MILNVENKSVFASDAGKKFDNSNPTIVLLHGSGLSHIVWSLTEQYLSNQNYNVISLDLPGHGNSDGPCLKSIEEIAEWMDKVFSSINIKDLILIGHSQGCLEALEYYYKFKNKVDKIIFIGGSYRIPVNQDLIDLAQAGDKKAVELMMKWGYEGSKKFIGGNPVEKIINSPRDIREVLAIDLVACNNYQNGKNVLEKIDCPSLFIFGEKDKMIPIEKGTKFANSVKNSLTHVINKCGHMIMFENAFEMREKISEFLKK